MHCCRSAVAVYMGSKRGTVVYQLDGPSPGRLILHDKYLDFPSWSSCGSLLAGFQSASVAVFDRRTGSRLALLKPQLLCSRYEVDSLTPEPLFWTPAGQLALILEIYTTAKDETSQLLSVCSFV